VAIPGAVRWLSTTVVEFTEAQLLAWITPLLWPFLRVLAMFSSLPVLGTRTVPMRVRVALAALVAIAAQASLPAMPVVPLDSALAFGIVAQQVVIGLAVGFSVRIVFAAIEYAGEMTGLQMGLNFAGFFDPVSASQGTATGRFYGTMVAWLFVVINGHLLVLAALLQSFRGLSGRAGAFRLPARDAAAPLGRRDLPHRAVDRAAADRDAAVREPRARHGLARRGADPHLRGRLPDHARGRPDRHAADAADAGDAVHDGAGAPAVGLALISGQDSSLHRRHTLPVRRQNRV
jgi:hypothetical protein